MPEKTGRRRGRWGQVFDTLICLNWSRDRFLPPAGYRSTPRLVDRSEPARVRPRKQKRQVAAQSERLAVHMPKAHYVYERRWA